MVDELVLARSTGAPRRPAPSALAAPPGGFFINASSNLYMSVENANTQNGTPVIQNYGDARLQEIGNQFWRLIASPNSSFAIRNGKSGKCLEPVGGSTADGAKLAQFTCETSTSQHWRFSQIRPGIFQIVNVKSGLCAGLPPVGPDNRGTQFVQKSCANANDVSLGWVFSK
jgi:Ricin-type beta-trefoil lectin domain-like